MIEVEMSKDIRETPPKIVGPFTKRQLAVVCISCAYGIPVIAILNAVGLQFVVAVFIAIVLMAPTIVCGWVTVFGIPLEKFAVHMFKTAFLLPKRRVYASRNLYLDYMDDYETADEEKKNSARSRGKAKS